MLFPLTFWQSASPVLALPGPLVAYYPLDEPNGTAALDSSGNNRNGTYTNATLNQAGALNRAASFAATGYITLPASVGSAFSGSEGTASAFFRIPTWATWQNNTNRRILTLQADANNRVLLTHEATTINQLGWFYVAGGTVKSVTLSHATNVAGGWVHVALTWNKAQDRVRAYINGAQQGATLTGLGTFAGTPATLFIGAASAVPGNPWSGLLDEAAIWSRELSATEIASIATPTTRIQLVCEGDSRTVGQGATSTSANYVSQLADYLSASAQYKISNVATSGNTVATMQTQIAAEVTPLYNSANVRNIAVLWGGVNDAAAGADAATIWSRQQAWCTAVRALGYKVILCTEIDAQNAVHNAVNYHSTIWPALLTLQRAGWSSVADGLADLAADARLQDATNGTYFITAGSDFTHLTTAGYGVVASIVGPAVAAL